MTLTKILEWCDVDKHRYTHIPLLACALACLLSFLPFLLPLLSTTHRQVQEQKQKQGSVVFVNDALQRIVNNPLLCVLADDVNFPV